MAGAFVDGALKGFEMMERHQARKDEKARLSDMDAFKRQEYTDQKNRQAQIDKQNAIHRKEEVTLKNKEFDSLQQYRTDTLNNSNLNLKEKQQNNLWKQAHQEKQDLHNQDISILPAAFDLLEQEQALPKEYEEVFERNPHLDPRRLFEKEAGESVDTVQRVMGEVAKTGEMAQFNSPEFKGAINNVFGHRFKKAIGQYDPLQKSKIVDSEFYAFIPAPREKKLSDVQPDGKVDGEKFAMSMLVTYENGNQEVKPLTRGGTTEPDDPVTAFAPKDLIGQLKPVFVAREIAKSPEMYRRHIKSIRGTQQGGSQQKEAPQKAEYRKAKSQLLAAKAKALSDIESGKGAAIPLSGDAKITAIKGVEAQFKNQSEQLDSLYGASPSPESKGGGGDNKAKYISKIDGVDAGGVIKKFMEANKNLTEQQATQIAIQQGYLSNGQ